MTRLELLEHVNRLNSQAAVNDSHARYWTVTVLYNTVIWRDAPGQIATMYEVIEGEIK